MCQARRLNIQVAGLKDGVSPEKDTQTLGNMLGYKASLPITKA